MRIRALFVLAVIAFACSASDATGITVYPGRPAVHSYVRNATYESSGTPWIPICTDDDAVGTGYGGTCFGIHPDEKTVALTVLDSSNKTVSWGYAWDTEPVIHASCLPKVTLTVPEPSPEFPYPRPTGVLAIMFDSYFHRYVCAKDALATAGIVMADYGYGPVVVRPSPNPPRRPAPPSGQLVASSNYVS